jgi:hypothetical protein
MQQLRVPHEMLRRTLQQPPQSRLLTSPVRTSQETHHVSATKPNRLILFRETVVVYCENHMEHTQTLCGQSARVYLYNVKEDGTYNSRCDLNS